MSVTQYTIGCGYELLKLKDTVFFLSKNSLKTITIDNGESYAAINDSVSPNQLKGFNVKLTETESLDERYVFTKQLTMSIHGHLTDSTFLLDDDYYIVVQTEDGTYYLVNVDFPSKMSFVYNLSEGQDQTDFTFVSNSNHPTLKLNWNPTSYNDCSTYQTFGIDSIKLLEKDYTSIDSEGKVINLFDGNEFKNIDCIRNTISLQENYDGKIATTTISFEIPYDNYKPSWQYNLLEFNQNLYVAHITPKNSTSGIFCGYEHGLQPQYELNGSTSNGESTSIKITLVEASEWGLFEFDTWSYYRDSSKRWIGIDSEVKCIGLGVGINTLMEEVDGNGTPTQRYKCLEGYESAYTNYNIVGTYTEDEVESFRTSVCTRFRARGTATSMYTCVNGDKYELVRNDLSYDGGKHWIFDDGYYTIGDLIESGASECEVEPEVEWVLNEDKFTCIDHFERWIPSGTTCINGDKYQNNIKQVSTDGGHTWEDVVPTEYSASTLIESDSYYCGYRTSATTSATYCSNANQYVDVYSLVSRDYGETWTTASTSTELIEEDVVECGFSARTISTATTCVGVDKHYLDEYQESTDYGRTWTTISSSTGSLIESNSYDCGYRTGTTSGDPYCQGYDKYVEVYYRTSTDGGTTWVTASTTPTLVEAQSEDCGYIPPTPTQYRWTQSGTTCIGYDKYQNNIKQVSTDGGETWTVVIPEEYSASTLIEADSQDCGYVPPTPTIDGKFKLTLSDSSTVTAECDATSAITSGEVSSHSSGRVVIVSAEIGQCVSTIGDAAFANLSLTSVTIPDSVTSIDNWAFGYCTGLTSVSIPNSLTSISSYAFYRCTGLTSVSIPNSLTSIGSQAFFQCSSLTGITIPDSLTSIGGYAFYQCSSLISITIPDSVTSIDDWAFGYCTRLRSVTVNATTPPTLGGNVFNNTSSNLVIYVPSASVDTYKTASGWRNYASRIQAIP